MQEDLVEIKNAWINLRMEKNMILSRSEMFE